MQLALPLLSCIVRFGCKSSCAHCGQPPDVVSGLPPLLSAGIWSSLVFHVFSCLEPAVLANNGFVLVVGRIFYTLNPADEKVQ